jgi:hypothetical protein
MRSSNSGLPACLSSPAELWPGAMKSPARLRPGKLANLSWHHSQRGHLRLHVKAVKSRTAAADPTGEASRHGRFIAGSYMWAWTTITFFPSASILTWTEPPTASCARKTATAAFTDDEPAKKCMGGETRDRENRRASKSTHKHGAPENGLVINADVKNYLGYPVGYALMGGENVLSLMVSGGLSAKTSQLY